MSNENHTTRSTIISADAARDALDLSHCILSSAIGSLRAAAERLGDDQEADTVFTVAFALERALALAENAGRGIAASPTPDPIQPADPRVHLAALDIEPDRISRLQRVADAQYDGDLKWTIAEIIDGALVELWEGGE